MATPPRLPEGAGLSPSDALALLRSALDGTADGVLVVDLDGVIRYYNRRFAEIWGLPSEVLEAGDDRRALDEAVAHVRDPDAFRARVEEIYADPERTSFDTFEMADGRIIERSSRPQMRDGTIVGRVWSFRDVTEARRARAELEASEARYRSLFEESRQAIYVSTPEGRLLDINPAAMALFEIPPDRVGSINTSELYQDAEARQAFKEAMAREGGVTAYPVALRSLSGRTMECLLTSTARRDSDGNVVAYQGIVEDVTERLRAERALQESERKFRSLIEGASDTITIVDRDGVITYESPSLERVLGWRPEELIGRSVFDFVHEADRADALLAFGRVVDDGSEAIRAEVRFLHKDGAWRTLEAVARNLLDEPGVQGIIVNARDVTERKEAEDRLLFDAFHDKLTGLPNRALFMDRVGHLIQRGSRSDAAPFAVLFLDMDRFKVVNDSLGHMVGDQLLMAVARRLSRSLRPGDTVARLGGDEFTMLLDGATLEDARRVARRIEEDFSAPFQIGEHELFTTVSVGIAVGDPRYAHPEEMLRDADVAMYRAKEGGRARVEVFDESMRTEAVARLTLENELRRALSQGELVVHYQPIVRLDDGALRAFEALVRWAHPERGLLAPAAFLRIAEDTGLVLPLGTFVLESVCAQVSAWLEDPGRAVPVHVNVSADQLSRPDFVDAVAGALERSRIPSNLLSLELTESIMMQNAEATVRTLERLSELGVGLAIDDFGTGYSSLSYLHRFPTSSVKIDRSFVARMGPQDRQRGIVRTIIDLARDLSMGVVAEGIETEEQAAVLRDLQCEAGQGYLFARPQDAAAATAFLAAQEGPGRTEE